MGNFEYYNVEFGRSKGLNRLVIRGQIKNNSGRSYNTVAVRVILFNKNVVVISTLILINGLSNGMVRDFEREIEEVEYDKIAKDITRHEIFVETAY